MRETLAVEVEEFLRVHGAATSSAIAIGVCARRDDVDDVLTGDKFKRVPAPDGCSPRASYFNLSYLVLTRRARTLNRADRMLSVLRDRQPHSREEIFERVGFMLTNNAASELRRSGHTIEQRRERGLVIYQLVSGLDEAVGYSPFPAASSSPNGPDAA